MIIEANRYSRGDGASTQKFTPTAFGPLLRIITRHAGTKNTCSNVPLLNIREGFHQLKPIAKRIGHVDAIIPFKKVIMVQRNGDSEQFQEADPPKPKLLTVPVLQ